MEMIQTARCSPLGAHFLVSAIVIALAGVSTGQDQNVSVRFFNNAIAMAGEMRLQHSLYVTIGRNAALHASSSDTWVTILRSDLGILRRFDPATPAGCNTVRIQDAAFDGKDTVAVSILCWGAEGQPSNKLVLFELSTGKMMRVQAIHPIKCTAMDFAQSGEILCLGLDVHRLEAKDFSYSLLYRFDRQGTLLSRSVRRDTLPSSGVIEMWTYSGRPRVFAWGDSRIALWFPVLAHMVVTDAAGNELWRHHVPSEVPDAFYSLAIADDRQICAFLPSSSLKSAGPPRYQVACLTDNGGNAILPSRIREQSPIPAVWKFRSDWMNFHRAGKSTVLVGFHGNSPVLWNKTMDSQIITLSHGPVPGPAQGAKQ